MAAPELSKHKAAPLQVLRDAVKANKLLVSAAKEGWWKGVFQAPLRNRAEAAGEPRQA